MTTISKRLTVNEKRIGQVIRLAVEENIKTDKVIEIIKETRLVTEAYFYEPVIRQHLPRDLDQRSGLLVLEEGVYVPQDLSIGVEVNPLSEPLRRIRSHSFADSKEPHTGASSFKDIYERAASVTGEDRRSRNQYGHTMHYLPSTRLVPANLPLFYEAMKVKLGKDGTAGIVPMDFVRKNETQVGKIKKLLGQATDLGTNIASLMRTYRTLAEVIQVWPQGEHWIRKALENEGAIGRQVDKSKALTTAQSRDAISRIMGWN